LIQMACVVARTIHDALPICNIVIGIAEVQEEDPHLAPAIRLAEALGATLHVVHAFRLPDPVLYPYASVSVFDPEVVQQIQEGAQDRKSTRLNSSHVKI